MKAKVVIVTKCVIWSDYYSDTFSDEVVDESKSLEDSEREFRRHNSPWDIGKQVKRDRKRRNAERNRGGLRISQEMKVKEEK